MKTKWNVADERISLGEVLSGLEVEDPVSWKNLQVFPIVGPNGHAPAYALIDDLLEQGDADVMEVDDEGLVPTVRVGNRSDLDAMLLDGLELKGAKQNRMVNVTVIVGKHSNADISVSCVEEGRWSSGARKFGSAKRTVAAKLRSQKAHMVAESLGRGAATGTDQGEVWDHVRSYVADSESCSETLALGDVFEERKPDLDEILQALGNVNGRGAVVAVNGEIVSLDVFDSSSTFKKVWPGLLRGVALEALLDQSNGSAGVDVGSVGSWFSGLERQTVAERRDVAGVGTHYVVSGPAIAGSVTFHEAVPVHVAIFPGDQG